MPNNQLKMILEVNGDEVRRKFDKSMKKTTFGKAISKLRDKKDLVTKIIPISETIFKKIFQDDFDKLFFSFQDVPWHLDLIGKEVIKTKGDYWITIKACKSHQFFDIYRIATNGRRDLLLAPFFHKAPHPKPQEENDEIIRGVADTILFLAPAILDHKGAKGIDDLFDWFEIVLQIVQVKKSGKNLFDLQIAPKVPSIPSPTDERKHCVYIYSEVRQKIKPILVASPNVRTAIQELSEVWHNPLAKTVLLSAYSGSGKEELKELLIYGLRVKKNQIIELSAPQVASSQKPLHDIYDNLNTQKLINKKTKRIKKPVVLYLDEIHHGDVEKLRTTLLRFIETAELTIDSKKIDCEGVLFLFAASKPPEELRTLQPPDFWTRVEYTVTMKHPLLLDDPIDRNNILKQYFCLFWRLAAHQRQRADKSQIIPLLMQHVYLEELSGAFAEALDSPLIPVISIRTIRSIVNRLFSRAIYYVRTDKVKKADIIRGIKSNMETWIIKIFNEIVPEIRPQGVF